MVKGRHGNRVRCSIMHKSCEDVVENMYLLTEILLWLPTKQVLRCKCVCKKWLALLSEPQFFHLHTLRLCNHPFPRSIFLQKYVDESHMKSYIIPFTSSVNDASLSAGRTIQLDFQVYFNDILYSTMQSCNGLVLWNVHPTGRFYGKEEYFQRSSFHVCNPATGHCMRLNYPSVEFSSLSSRPYLSFEPLKSPYYKVIVLRLVKEMAVYDRLGRVVELIDRKFEISIYSSEMGSCSEDGVYISTSFKVSASDGTYCNGSIHWYNRPDSLVYFDVHRLCFNELSGPTSVDWNDVYARYFRESGGHLHLIISNNGEVLEFDIWELKEDYSGWVMRYHVDLNLMGQGDVSSLQINPFGFLLSVVCQPNEEESMLVLFANSKIMSYSLKDHRIRILHELDGQFKSFHHIDTLSCTAVDYDSHHTSHGRSCNPLAIDS